MSIQDGHDDQAEDLGHFDDPAYDEASPEQLAAVQQQLAAVQQGQLEEQLGAFVDQFPKYSEKEAATAFVEEVNRRAEALAAPHLANSPEFFRTVAADVEREERIEAERYERSDEARIDRIFRPGNSSRVLPFG